VPVHPPQLQLGKAEPIFELPLAAAAEDGQADEGRQKQSR
jgi:hypothetical protein